LVSTHERCTRTTSQNERERETYITGERKTKPVHTVPSRWGKWPRLTDCLTAEATATTNETRKGILGGDLLPSPLHYRQQGQVGAQRQEKGKRRARERDEREREMGKGF
jgi:hypothetical protein